MPILIDRAIKTPLLDITVIGCSVPHLKGGAMKDFLKIMKMTGRYIPRNWNDTNRKYTFSNGSIIEFVNADGDKAIGPRRNILYINEANLINYTIYNQLAIRTSGDIYIDFNPANEFWAHKEVLTENDSEMIILNYTHNEALSDTIIKELESKKEKGFYDDGSIKNEFWANWWRVYGVGELGRLEGTVYNNWEIIDELPEDCELIATGLDWGYTNDVTAIVNVYKYYGKIIVDEICYQRELLNKQISEILLENNIDGEIIADSSEPKSIEELKQYGHYIRGAEKGPGSVIHGINILQEYEILITRKSKNAIEEFTRYSWEIDKDNRPLNKPKDKDNHICDALRYVAILKLKIQDDYFISF